VTRKAKTQDSGAPAPAATQGIERVGVIEIGSTSVRLVIAEIEGRRRFRVLDTLQRPVSLGKDTFTGSEIGRDTIEECVGVLRSFQHALDEVQVDPARVRVVATSAVREADNRDAFLDRIAIATGLKVEVLHEAEVTRLMYLAVRPVLDPEPAFRKADTVVIEVGGGSTETLAFRKGKVSSAHMYRLGALRIRNMIDQEQGPAAGVEDLLSQYIRDTAERISASVASPAGGAQLRLLALGSEARLACARSNPAWDGHSLAAVRAADLAALADTVRRLSVDEVVRRYRLTYPEAETLAPALLLYAQLAEALQLDEILVADANLRSGVLWDLCTGGTWTAEFRRQVVHSALTIGRKYRVDMRHARSVSRFALQIFEAMRREHRLGVREEVILEVASLIHEAGYFVNNNNHHKHSLYLILNSDIFGLGARDLMFAALVARYHRGGMPKPSHPEFAALPREDRMTVSKLAAMLRVANSLDREGSHEALTCRVSAEPGVLVIRLDDESDLAYQRHRMHERAEMFQDVYGMRVELRGERGIRTDERGA
jgi:exopolyphosphatase/guanosine-5'-triphosphate,3'-diphosphate pyrophosphatase